MQSTFYSVTCVVSFWRKRSIGSHQIRKKNSSIIYVIWPKTNKASLDRDRCKNICSIKFRNTALPFGYTAGTFGNSKETLEMSPSELIPTDNNVGCPLFIEKHD